MASGEDRLIWGEGSMEDLAPLKNRYRQNPDGTFTFEQGRDVIGQAESDQMQGLAWQARNRPQTNIDRYWLDQDIAQGQASRGLQQQGLGQLREAAMGNAPSQAALMANMARGRAAATGVGATGGLAARQAAMGQSQAMQAAAMGGAGARSDELGRATGAYLGGTGQAMGGDLRQRGASADEAYQTARTGLRDKDMAAKYGLGYERLGQGYREMGTGAVNKVADMQASAAGNRAQRNAQREQQWFQAGMGGITGALSYMSGITTKTDIAPAASAPKMGAPLQPDQIAAAFGPDVAAAVERSRNKYKPQNALAQMPQFSPDVAVAPALARSNDVPVDLAAMQANYTSDEKKKTDVRRSAEESSSKSKPEQGKKTVDEKKKNQESDLKRATTPSLRRDPSWAGDKGPVLGPQGTERTYVDPKWTQFGGGGRWVDTQVIEDVPPRVTSPGVIPPTPHLTPAPFGYEYRPSWGTPRPPQGAPSTSVPSDVRAKKDIKPAGSYGKGLIVGQPAPLPALAPPQEESWIPIGQIAGGRGLARIHSDAESKKEIALLKKQNAHMAEFIGREHQLRAKVDDEGSYLFRHDRRPPGDAPSGTKPSDKDKPAEHQMGPDSPTLGRPKPGVVREPDSVPRMPLFSYGARPAMSAQAQNPQGQSPIMRAAATSGGDLLPSRDRMTYTGIVSDERQKSGGPGSGTADAFLDSLSDSASTYRYKDPSMEPSTTGGTGGKYLGIMAQRVEQTPEIGKQLVKDTPQGKVVEGQAMLSALAGGLGRLHQKVKEMEGRRGR